MISIIMGIYNCAPTLIEALDSIVNQTYTDWELIMCDDGSSDKTYEIAEDYIKKHPQYEIKLIRHSKNKGLNETLNDCLKEAKGEYIGRMDADDVSLPMRFEKEIAEFEKEPNLAVVSCPMIYFDENGDWGSGKCSNVYPKKENLVFGTVHAHAPCLIKTEVMQAVNGYSVEKKLLRVEDWHLWIKIYASGYYGKNLQEPLYKMRDDQLATKRRKFKFRLNEAYVSKLAVKTFKLPKRMYLYSMRFIIVGLLPAQLYNFLHRKRLDANRCKRRK